MNLFKLQSYIKRPKVKIDNLSILNQNSSDYFVRLDDKDLFMGIMDDIDRDYIEGVIHFEYNGSVIMDFTYWDIIDQLWAYLINSIEDYIKSQESEIYFPDQPIKLKMKAINKNLVLFSIESNDGIQLTLPKQELFQSLLDSGEAFFLRLQDYFDGGLDYSNEIEQINALRNKMK